MTTALATLWQVKLRDLLMGRDTPYRVEKAPRLARAVRTSDLELTQGHGILAMGDYAGALTFSVGLIALGSTPAHAEALVDSLVSAWDLSSTEDLPLVYRLAQDREWLLVGRPRRCEADWSTLKYGHVSVACQFVATKPWRYSVDEVPAVVPLGGDPGTDYGLRFPVEFPVRFQPEGSPPPGLVRLNNDGGAPASVVVTITTTVDLVDPILENVTTGASLQLTGTIHPGDVVVIDMDARSIRLNGANRLGLRVPGTTYWNLAPGPNLIRFTSPTTLSGAVASIRYRHTWPPA